jgi:hypothetical protein
MKTKILGILVMTLLIATATLPMVGNANDNKNSFSEDWAEKDKIIASDGASGDYFGFSVSIDGDYALIGACDDDDNGLGSGSAYVFKRSGTTWTEEDKLTALDGAPVDRFGFSVSIDGDYAIIGADCDDDNGFNSGSAYIFKRSGTTWDQQAKLLASDGWADDVFGNSVSINGDYALIGAYGDYNGRVRTGSAYVFKRSGTTWTEEDKLTASDGASDDLFGNSVSINGDYALIGACHDDDNGPESGSAYVFKRSGTTWTEEDKLTASDGASGSGDGFGSSVSIDGDYALIGARDDNDNGFDSGSAYIFKRSGTTWDQQAKLLASDGASGDGFGSSVSIDGDYALIGAYHDFDNGPESGSAYVFKRSGTTWTEEDKLTASDGAILDWFGYSVSINGDYALIGACYDDDNGPSSGSAYVFKKATPDLVCEGTLSWTNIQPGKEVTGSLWVANGGEVGTKLSWKIESYPTWGVWTFVPSSGNGLTPAMGSITITVEVVAPNGENTVFSGYVKIVNTNDPTDTCRIPVSLSTPKNKAITINSPFLQFLENHPHLFPLLRQLMEL